jgi:hypothetical protein
MAAVRIFPRRKGGEQTCADCQAGRACLQLDLSAIEPLFTTTQKNAARRLGISVSALKKVCRKLGVHSWADARDSLPTSKIRQSILHTNDPANTCLPAPAEYAAALEQPMSVLCTDILSPRSPVTELMSIPTKCQALDVLPVMNGAWRLATMPIGSNGLSNWQQWHDVDDCANDLSYLVPLPKKLSNRRAEAASDEAYTVIPELGVTAGWLQWYSIVSSSLDCL